MLTEMHDEFLVLIEAINELLELQKHAKLKYYPEFVSKVNVWYETQIDERTIRDMIRKQVFD